MMTTKLTRTAKAKMLAKVADLTDKINRCKHTESLGRGSPLSTMPTDIIRRENGMDAYRDRQKLEAELRAVCEELIAAGCKSSTINGYSRAGNIVALVGTDQWEEVRPGKYVEIKRPTVTI